MRRSWGPERPPAPAPHAQAARLLRKSVFQVTDCSAPPPDVLPHPDSSPSCLGSFSCFPAQTEPEDTQKDTRLPKIHGNAGTHTQQQQQQKWVTLNYTTVHLEALKTAQERFPWTLQKYINACNALEIRTPEGTHHPTPWNGSYKVALPHTGRKSCSSGTSQGDS